MKRQRSTDHGCQDGKRRQALLAFALFAVVACPRGGKVRIARGSREDSLVFTASTWINYLEVRPCGQPQSWNPDSSRYRAVLWAIQSDTNWRLDHIREISYGLTPAGFKTVIPVRPLGEGCYWTAIDAYPGHVAFKVDSGGTVREVKWSDTLAGLPASR